MITLIWLFYHLLSERHDYNFQFNFVRYFTVLFGVSRSIGIGSQVWFFTYFICSYSLMFLWVYLNCILSLLFSWYGTELLDCHSRGQKVLQWIGLKVIARKQLHLEHRWRECVNNSVIMSFNKTGFGNRFRDGKQLWALMIWSDYNRHINLLEIWVGAWFCSISL